MLDCWNIGSLECWIGRSSALGLSDQRILCARAANCGFVVFFLATLAKTGTRWETRTSCGFVVFFFTTKATKVEIFLRFCPGFSLCSRSELWLRGVFF